MTQKALYVNQNHHVCYVRAFYVHSYRAFDAAPMIQHTAPFTIRRRIPGYQPFARPVVSALKFNEALPFNS